MSMEATYNLFYGLLLCVLAAFTALPAWNRWTRNLLLVRKGVKIQGHYHGKGIVVFQIRDNRQVKFTTWRRALGNANIGDALPVLYDPADPTLAEVMRAGSLWAAPFSNLTTAMALVLQAVCLFGGMNRAVSVLLLIGTSFGSFILANLALFIFYPPSRLQQFAESGVEQKQGKSYNHQRRRWQRRLAWKTHTPALPQFEPEAETLAPVQKDELLVSQQESLTEVEQPLSWSRCRRLCHAERQRVSSYCAICWARMPRKMSSEKE